MKAVTPNFFPPNLWPSNTQHLVHAGLQKWMYKTKIKVVPKLWERTVNEWDKLDQCMYRLNISREHFSLLMLCHVLFLKGSLLDCLLVN